MLISRVHLYTSPARRINARGTEESEITRRIIAAHPGASRWNDEIVRRKAMIPNFSGGRLIASRMRLPKR